MEERKLTRQDLRRCWRAWMMHNLSSMSFERLESFGFCLSIGAAPGAFSAFVCARLLYGKPGRRNKPDDQAPQTA